MADLISQRDQGRQELFDTIDLFCKEVDVMPLQEREQSLQVRCLGIKKKTKPCNVRHVFCFWQNYCNLGFFLYILFIAQCSFGLPGEVHVCSVFICQVNNILLCFLLLAFT